MKKPVKKSGSKTKETKSGVANNNAKSSKIAPKKSFDDEDDDFEIPLDDIDDFEAFDDDDDDEDFDY